MPTIKAPGSATSRCNTKHRPSAWIESMPKDDQKSENRRKASLPTDLDSTNVSESVSKRRRIETRSLSNAESHIWSVNSRIESQSLSTVTADTSAPPLALTRDNLKRFNMSQGSPNTPSRSAKSSTITTTSTQSARIIRERLATHDILIDAVPWYTDAEIKAFVEEVVLLKRDSPGLSKDAQERLTKTVRAVKNMVESNVTLALVDLIYPRPEYFEDGQSLLLRNHDVDFLPNAIPKPDAEDNPAFQAALLAAGVPKNPKPDFAFGVSEKAFTREQLHMSKIFPSIAGLSKGMLYPFLVVEWKSSASGGTQYDAQNQAARSGGALVYSVEQLCAHANAVGGLDVPLLSSDGSTAGGANKGNSVVFSNTLDSESAYLWVHWCQPTEDATTTARNSYHMSLIKRYWLDEPDEVWALRRMIDNIIDWGLNARLDMIKGLLRAIQIPLSPTVSGAKKRKAVE